MPHGRRVTAARGHGPPDITTSRSRSHRGNTLDPFTPEQIDSLAQLTAELAERYQFPVERIPFLSQTGTPPRGICTHEDSANGRKTGKTDPGPMFPWAQFLTAAAAYMMEEDEMGMTPAEQARMKWLEDTVALMSRAPADVLAPDGKPFNLYLRDLLLLAAQRQHEADGSAHGAGDE